MKYVVLENTKTFANLYQFFLDTVFGFLYLGVVASNLAESGNCVFDLLDSTVALLGRTTRLLQRVPGPSPQSDPLDLDGAELSPKSVWLSTVQEAIDRDVDSVVIAGDVVDQEKWASTPRCTASSRAG